MIISVFRAQPPPRGCVLKQIRKPIFKPYRSAAASARLCVETVNARLAFNASMQPPPRGCVLKQAYFGKHFTYENAAASARLCVETSYHRL